MPPSARKALVALLLMATGASAPLDDRSALIALETRWNAAVVTGDVAVLEQILDPAFLFVAPDGSESDRAALLGQVARRRVTVDPFVTEGLNVRVFGDAAVITGWFTQTVRLGDRSDTGRYRYTDVYVRDGAHGPWRAVSA